jgi:hypothetical protein
VHAQQEREDNQNHRAVQESQKTVHQAAIDGTGVSVNVAGSA